MEEASNGGEEGGGGGRGGNWNCSWEGERIEGAGLMMGGR